MAGRTERAAVNNYLRPVQQVLSCVTNEVIVAYGTHRGEVHSATLARGGSTLLSGPNPIRLRLAQKYQVLKDKIFGPYRVHCESYVYALEDNEYQEIISFHWHPGPSGYKNPHIHLGAGAHIGLRQLEKAHIPSGRIAIEDVVLCAIRDFDVTPLRGDWETVIERHHEAFIKYRTWG